MRWRREVEYKLETETANVGIIAGLIGQRTVNARAIGIMIHVLQERESAAHFLYPHEVFGSYPISIRTGPVLDEDILESTGRIPRIPAACNAKIGKYFRIAFEKAFVRITLSQRTNMKIYFKLKGLKPVKDPSGAWILYFEIDLKTAGVCRR